MTEDDKTRFQVNANNASAETYRIARMAREMDVDTLRKTCEASIESAMTSMRNCLELLENS